MRYRKAFLIQSDTNSNLIYDKGELNEKAYDAFNAFLR